MTVTLPYTSRNPQSPSGKQPRLPVEEATRIIQIARRKSSDGASHKARNLRVFLGHVHVAETLKHEFVDVDESSHHVTASSPSRLQQIQWADSLPRPSVSTEDERLAFEDDGEEDFCS